MRIISICLCLFFFCFSAFADENADSKIEALSEQVEKMNLELKELSSKLNSIVKNENINSAESENEREIAGSEGKATSEQTDSNKDEIVRKKSIDELLTAIEKLAQNQVELQRQLADVTVETTQDKSQEISESTESAEVYVGEEGITDPEPEVLYQYGNVVGESEPRIIYEESEPVYIRGPVRYYEEPKFGIRFRFGTGSDFWGRRRVHHRRYPHRFWRE